MEIASMETQIGLSLAHLLDHFEARKALEYSTGWVTAGKINLGQGLFQKQQLLLRNFEMDERLVSLEDNGRFDMQLCSVLNRNTVLFYCLKVFQKDFIYLKNKIFPISKNTNISSKSMDK